MSEQEKLIEIINDFFGCDAAYYDINPLDLAIHLLANGVRLEENQATSDESNRLTAVEMVRCKDCKYYGSVQEPCHGRTQRFCGLHKGLVVVNTDTFCSYGKRRSND